MPNANASITANDVDNGSNDACGIDTLTIDNNSFDCSNVGANTIVLTATDVNGNSSTCSAVVNVMDTINPTAVCQNITAYLDANGSVSITAADVDNGSSDNCGIASLSIDTTDFRCENAGLSL